MPLSVTCPQCANDIPQPSECCPHCGHFGIFWNVRAATDADENKALKRRYDAAKAAALSRKAASNLQDFENAIAGSKAVIVRPEHDVQRLAQSSRLLYGTYYQQIEAELRLPDGNEWDELREVADTVLFANYKKHIRFGALSLDGVGALSYGTSMEACSITLRTDMISHRASVFEENSALFVKQRGIKVPKGYRASWDDRKKLCVAKLAGKIDAGTDPDKYSGILLRQATASEEEAFIEVHIFGPMTVLTMEKVVVSGSKANRRATVRKALEFKLRKHNVQVS